MNVPRANHGRRMEVLMRIENSSPNNNAINNIANISENSKIQAKSAAQKSKNDKSQSIYAGDLNLPVEDKIEQEREKARKMVMGLLENAFGSDLEIDKEVEKRSKHIDDLKRDNDEQTKLLKNIEEERNALKENYGITEDSQEEKDLQLLRKQREAFKNPNIQLSEEEQERLEQINVNGKTDYQSEMLRLDGSASEIQGEINDNNKLIREENAIIRGIGIERLKSHEMVDARKQGDIIADTANDNIKGIIIEEAKNKIDEETEKLKERIEEKKEEQEKLEEQTSTSKDKKKIKEDDFDDLYDLNSSLADVKNKAKEATLPDIKKSLNQVVNELKLTAEDLKGLVVDEES